MFTFARNICLSIVIVFFDSSTTDGNYQQGLAALLVFLCSTALHVYFLPYDDKDLNYLEGLGLVVSMLTLYCGLWTFAGSDVRTTVASVFIFIINGIWLLCVFTVLSSSYGSRVKVFLQGTKASCMKYLYRVEVEGGSNDDAVRVDMPSGGVMSDDGKASWKGKKIKGEGPGEGNMMGIINPLHSVRLDDKMKHKEVCY